MGASGLFSREEALAGLPARRASTLLFLIERRAARLVSQTQQATELFPNEREAQERDLAFMEAFALGREPSVRLTVQELERYAAHWADLVPDNPRLRAAIARQLGRKYRFPAEAVPGIRRALSLDDAAVQQAYQRLTGRPLATLYAPQLSVGDRLRWTWSGFGARVMDLPPFWLAFALTFALGLPQAAIAVPIAVARLGPLLGIALVVIFALVSFLTMTSMAEAAARCGPLRYGTVFTGRLCSEFLGPIGAMLLTVPLALLFFLATLAAVVAVAVTLAAVAPVSVAVWAAVFCTIIILLLARGSLRFSIGVLVVIAAVALVLMIATMALTVAHGRLAYVTTFQLPIRDLSPGSVVNTLGVVLMLYFGDAFVVSNAKVILPRDPSGRALIWGSGAGLAAIAAVLTVWILCINGSLDPAALAGQRGTVFTPLESAVGPAVTVMGVVIVLLLPGLAAIRCPIALASMVREWLPAHPTTVVALPREGGQIRLERRLRPADGPRVDLAYLGSDEHGPRFRVDARLRGRDHREEISVGRHWEISSLFERLPWLRASGIRLALDVLAAEPQVAHLQIASPLVPVFAGDWSPELLPATVPAALAAPRPVTPRSRIRDLARSLAPLAPMFGVFLLAEYLVLTGRDSFPDLLAIIGALTVPIFAGVIPILLLAATRRKGEVVPGVVLDFLGGPLVMAGVYAFYLGVLVLHGTVIWHNPVKRAVALLTAGAALTATMAITRTGAFAPRTVVELRHDLRPGEESTFAVTTSGAPATADVTLTYPDGDHHVSATSGAIPAFETVRAASFRLPASAAETLMVWAHQVTPDGRSEALPLSGRVITGDTMRDVALGAEGGQAVWPLRGAATSVDLALHGPATE